MTVAPTSIPGLQFKSISILVWTDSDSGLNYCLRGTLDQKTLIRMAEQIAK
ncbi:hypothetical protein [Dysosmobacter sp. Phy]